MKYVVEQNFVFNTLYRVITCPASGFIVDDDPYYRFIAFAVDQHSGDHTKNTAGSGRVDSGWNGIDYCLRIRTFGRLVRRLRGPDVR